MDKLITALSKVKFSYKLLVAGAGESSYVESLQQLSKQLGNNLNIEWVGWKKGQEKFDFLAGLDIFALTSHSENFAIVVIESLSVGTPVLISDQVGLYRYVKKNDYGWITSVDIDEIVNRLNEIQIEKEKIRKINFEAPNQIKNEYEPSKMAGEYIRLYSIR